MGFLFALTGIGAWGRHVPLRSPLRFVGLSLLLAACGTGSPEGNEGPDLEPVESSAQAYSGDPSRRASDMQAEARGRIQHVWDDIKQRQEREWEKHDDTRRHHPWRTDDDQP